MAEKRSRSMQHEQDLWDRIWHNKEGDVVIWQRPNIPMIAWVVLTLVSIFTNGTISNVIWYLAAASLAIWALMEIVWGANYFRRFLGAVVVLFILGALFKVGY